MTTQQIAWAASHEWYESYINGQLYVRDNYTFAGKLHSDVIAWTGTFKALREWAGY